MNQQDAIESIVAWLRAGATTPYANYGYDLYIPNLVRFLAKQHGKDPDDRAEWTELSPVLLSAAWELSRRGVLRPGVRLLGLQSTDEGSAGAGFSITPFGKQWLREVDLDTFVPTEPERLGELLARFEGRFGSGFHSRAQEAIRCYGAHAYLACCTMCGASAESILLRTAIAIGKDEAKVIGTYSVTKGRTRVENIVVGKARPDLASSVRALTGLLKYWRDDAAHGKATIVGETEAFTSIAFLLRTAMVVDGNWAELVGEDG